MEGVMPRAIRTVVNAVIVLLLAACFQGCATGDRRVNILYEPEANITGGFGDLYLVQSVRHATGEAAAIEWVLGRVTKKDGTTVGRVVTDIAPGNLVLDALNQELKRAGYNVIATDHLPDQGKAVNLTAVSMRIDETHGFARDEANSALKMTVEPRRDKAAIKTLSYQAEYSDSATTGRDVLPSEALQHTLQLLMSRAVPEIVKTLEQK
jgi:hypothetical protein